jgi:indoleacetamide hydrolase
VYDTAGPHARTVSDLALFDSVVTSDFSPLQAVSLNGVRLGISRTHYYRDLDPEVDRVTTEALKRLADAGAVLIERDVPDLTKLVDAANFPIIQNETVAMITKYLEEFGTGITFDQLFAMISPDVKGALELFALPGGKLRAPKEAYEAARGTYRPALQRTFRQYFCETGVAAIVFPTTLVPPTPIGEDQEVEINGKKIPHYVAMSRNIAPGSCAGIPGLVLSAGLTKSGLPVGIEFDGSAGTDRELLTLGVAVERALGAPAPPRI